MKVRIQGSFDYHPEILLWFAGREFCPLEGLVLLEVLEVSDDSDGDRCLGSWISLVLEILDSRERILGRGKGVESRTWRRTKAEIQGSLDYYSGPTGSFSWSKGTDFGIYEIPFPPSGVYGGDKSFGRTFETKRIISNSGLGNGR
ncbi:hypothetical protein KM043_002491 [Ampulex compressa]|nr:hypothetical protein KM043_002491 [Ampulex compressa]